jgi:hypothetical protein
VFDDKAQKVQIGVQTRSGTADGETGEAGFRFSSAAWGGCPIGPFRVLFDNVDFEVIVRLLRLPISVARRRIALMVVVSNLGHVDLLFFIEKIGVLSHDAILISSVDYCTPLQSSRNRGSTLRRQ